MKKLAMTILGASLMVGGVSAFAANNNAQQNAAADAGMEAPGSHQQMAPKGTDNNNINTGNGTPEQAQPVDKNAPCNDGSCTNQQNHVEHRGDSKSGAASDSSTQ
ncbi:hypothetical protein TUM12370_26730 [Salmonella enterica subsp. enterica serovar Choleraesuis]|nr:hypothetical protein TUM12370_26730 [Salmonella enterica subsp. enterica serovar Choleraesuis]